MLPLASRADIHCAVLHGLSVLTAHRYLVPINSMRTGSWRKEKIQISNFHETMVAKLALFHYFTWYILILLPWKKVNHHLYPIRQRLNLQQKCRECCCPKNHVSWPAFKLHLTMPHDAFMNPTPKANITSLWGKNNENSRILTVLHNLTDYCFQREQVPAVEI